MTTYRSNSARLVRIVVPAALGLIVSMLAYMVQLNREGLSLFYSASIVIIVGSAGIAVRVVHNAVAVTIDEKTVHIRNGFRLLGTRPQSIPLEYIHTIRILALPQKYSSPFRPGLVTLVHRWPARKMLHAATAFSVAAIPDGAELLLELAERTGATIKIHTGAIADETITAEELRERLGAEIRD